MNILLLTGMSGSGKTTIARELSNDDSNFSLIRSYTDRSRRMNENKVDHHFISKRIMKLMLTYDIVASTYINGHYYCSTFSQFDKHKINVYVVDKNGIDDVKKSFKDAQIFSVLVKRDNINIDQSRKKRYIVIPDAEDVDFVLENNANLLKVVENLRQKVLSEFGVKYV